MMTRHGQPRRRPSNSTGDAKLLLPGHLTTTTSDASSSSLEPAKATGLVVAGTTSFSADEEDLLLRLHALLGNRWPVIAGRLPGRTVEEVKAYWDSLMTTTNLQRADYDNHRVLLQVLLASHDDHGEQRPSAMQNVSDVAASNDGGVSDAGSSNSNRWTSHKDHLLN
ncbi:unnamed protein product [Alopecurus aequalis]